MSTIRKCTAIVAIVYADSVSAHDKPWSVNLETGDVWQSRNDVRIPGNSGSRFSIADSVADGPLPFVRFESLVYLSDRTQLRFLIAPFRFTESGVLDKDSFFVDQTFNAGLKTDFTYKFHSYRVSYRYLYKDTPTWRMWLGGTAKIRDAKIALQQGSVRASDSNVGFVPLFNVYSDYQINPRWRFVTDFDGLVGPQGRAVDLGLKFVYVIDEHWNLGAGYRTLEGGADNDEVYNFAWFHYAVICVDYRR